MVRTPARPHARRAAALLAAALAFAGCRGWPLGDTDEDFYRSAQAERAEYLERQVARLREDLRQAEESLVALESGLRSMHTRADAVSALAEARISVERASQSVSWRPDRVRDARVKLDEAERQLQMGHSGSAVFFATRARRIAEALNEEAREVGKHGSARFVNVPRVNLRKGPSRRHRVVDVLTLSTPVFPQRENGDWVLVRTISGPVGWVHASLLRR